MEKPLFWHQGLFLQPQHLQLNDRTNHSNLTPYHKYIRPWLYGVGNISINEPALSNYSFQIDGGEFWFGDRTYVVLKGNGVVEPRQFRDAWKDGSSSLGVYIGLKKQSETGENVTSIEYGESLSRINTRYITGTEPEEINDQHQGGSPAQIKKLTCLLKIFFHTETEQLGSYELIPIARIERSGELILVAANYIPPCLSIAASGILQAQLNDIFNQLSFRGRELESHKQKRGIHNAEFGSRDMVYLLALRSFNRYIPLLSSLAEMNEAHPWDIYSLLRQFIGELSSFSDQIDVLGKNRDGEPLLPAYDHENLWNCFSAAQKLVSQLLDEITAGPEYVLPLNFDDTWYSAVMKPEFFDGNNHYYLVVRTGEEIRDILDAVEVEVKAGSLKILPILIERALPGVALEYLPTPPQELPRRNDSIYFHIDNHGEQWAMIEQEKNFGLHWDDAPDDVRFEIMIVRRK